jgi:hypothetical protein
LSAVAEEGYTVPAYGAGSRNPVGMTGSGLAQRVKVNAPFSGFAFTVCTWTNANCTGYLSVYEWKGSYDATIDAEPLHSKFFEPFIDNGIHWVEFDPLPAGEYLFRLHDGSGGLWCNESNEVSLGYGYENGNEIIVDKMANMATYITTSIAQLKNHKADIMAQMICFETSTIMMDAIDTIAKLDVTSELYSPKALNKMKKTILKNTLQTEEFRRQIDDALSSTSAITTSSTASSAANEQAKILFKNRAAAKQPMSA